MPPKGDKRKRQIIDTLKEMFLENGYQGTHIRSLCKELNIARGTVYQYFSNKKEILFSILDLAVQKIEKLLDRKELLEVLNSNPEKKIITDLMHKRISGAMNVLVNEPIMIRLIFKEIEGIDAEITAKVNSAVEKIKSLVAEDIIRIQTKGLFKHVIDPNITASMLVGGIIMLVIEYTRKKENILDQKIVELITNSYLDASFV